MNVSASTSANDSRTGNESTYTHWDDDVRGVQQFVASLHTNNAWQYRVSHDASQPIAIASATAVLLLGFLGLETGDEEERQSWADALMNFQSEDGLIHDPVDEKHPTQQQPLWALRAHRTRHVAWAIEQLTGQPLRHSIEIAVNNLDEEALHTTLETLWNTAGKSGAWGWGNWVMDLGVLFDLHEKQTQTGAGHRALNNLLDWLSSRLDPQTGFWWLEHTDMRNAMAGAMHLYPLYWLVGRSVPHFENAVKRTLELQQPDGLFAYEIGHGGSQCLDFDAVFVLINGWHRHPALRQDIEKACKNVLKNIRQCRNDNGSWADSRIDQMRHWATQAAAFHASRGSVWDAYARMMTVAMCVEVLTGQPPQGVQTNRHLFEMFRPLGRETLSPIQ